MLQLRGRTYLTGLPLPEIKCQTSRRAFVSPVPYPEWLISTVCKEWNTFALYLGGLDYGRCFSDRCLGEVDISGYYGSGVGSVRTPTKVT